MADTALPARQKMIGLTGTENVARSEKDTTLMRLSDDLLPRTPLALVVRAAGVNGIEEVRIVDVDVNRVDANYRALMFVSQPTGTQRKGEIMLERLTILLVQCLDLPEVLELSWVDVVVELVPESHGGDFWAGETGEWVDGDAVEVDEAPV